MKQFFLKKSFYYFDTKKNHKAEKKGRISCYNVVSIEMSVTPNKARFGGWSQTHQISLCFHYFN